MRGGDICPRRVSWGRGHLTPGVDPYWEVSRTGPVEGAGSLPVPLGHTPAEHPFRGLGPWALRGWAGRLKVPPREPCAAGTWARGSPVGPSAQRRRPDLPPIGAARGGRALARPPSAAPGRCPGGPCVHEKCFSARPEGKLRLFLERAQGRGWLIGGPPLCCLLASSLPGPPLAPLTSPHKRGFYKNYLSLVFLIKSGNT